MVDKMLDCHKVVPVLEIQDIAKAKEFYIDVLGFALDWEDRSRSSSSVYMIISFKHIVIHLISSCERDCLCSRLFIEFSGISELKMSLESKGLRNKISDFHVYPTKTICLEVFDPSGNRLLFCEPFNS